MSLDNDDLILLLIPDVVPSSGRGGILVAALITALLVGLVVGIAYWTRDPVDTAKDAVIFNELRLNYIESDGSFIRCSNPRAEDALVVLAREAP